MSINCYHYLKYYLTCSLVIIINYYSILDNVRVHYRMDRATNHMINESNKNEKVSNYNRDKFIKTFLGYTMYLL